MAIITFSEKRFFEWHKDDLAVTIRNKGGSYGGGSEVLIVYDESDGCNDDERDIQQDH